MSDQETPRTAAASAARRRQGEERRAEFLRERGWTVIPPDGRVRLHAVIRPHKLADPSARSRVAILGPPAAGGRPRADLDGLGSREVASFYTPALLPAAPTHGQQLADLAYALAGAGYKLAGPWRFGTDTLGRVAVVEVTRVRP